MRAAADDPNIMSGLLARYTQQCKDSGFAMHTARYALVGVQSGHRRLQGRMKRAWEAL